MDEPEQDHPPAPAPHQAARIDGRTLARPGLLLRRRLTPRIRTWEGLKIALRPGGDTPIDHRHQPETEEHREQRVDPVINEEHPDEQPSTVSHRRVETSTGNCR